MPTVKFFCNFCQTPFSAEKDCLNHEKSCALRKHEKKKAIFSMRGGEVKVSVRKVDDSKNSLETGKLFYSKGVYFCYFTSEKELEKVKKEFFSTYLNDLKERKRLLEEEIENLEGGKEEDFLQKFQEIQDRWKKLNFPNLPPSKFPWDRYWKELWKTPNWWENQPMC